jgi:hypothetical protein
MLKDQHSRKVDIVAPATKITSQNGMLWIDDTDPEISEDGVTMTTGVYRPTRVCDEGISDKLRIPLPYLRRLRETRTDLLDANVNGWLHGSTNAYGELGDSTEKHDPDPRSFLVRCFRTEDGTGIARALLSDSYRTIDHIDVLMSSLQGIEDAGVQVTVDGCDLSDRRMYLRVVAPEVTVMADRLLKGYRNPFGEDFEKWRQIADREGLGYGDGEEPIVWAGLVVSNSEVGSGAFSITPQVVVKVCKNGLTIKKDMMREVHLGGKLEAGVVDWSEDTQRKSVELVRAKTRDAVRTFLDVQYLARTVVDLEQRAEEPVATVDEVKVLTKPLSFSPGQVDGILNRFIQGGQMTRAGVVNAITAHAQEVPDADVAAEMEAKATELLV